MNNEQPQRGRLLQGKEEIMKEYRLTEHTFELFLRLGMPVLLVGSPEGSGRRYYAHTENLDLFFKGITARRAPGNPPPEQ